MARKGTPLVADQADDAPESRTAEWHAKQGAVARAAKTLIERRTNLGLPATMTARIARAEMLDRAFDELRFAVAALVAFEEEA